MRAFRFLAFLVTAAVGVTACAGDASVTTTGRPSAAAPSTTTTEAVAADLTTTVVPPPPPPATESATPVTEPERLAAGLPEGEDTSVESVVDGDTIVVAGGTRVRLIGVDTPETKDPRTSVQCFGHEAAARTSSLLAPATPVRLVYDVERFDRYQRTLAYVYRRSDALFVNAALVADGYASVATYPPNVAHVEELTDLARKAREEGRGLWSACGDEPEATPPPAAVAPPGSTSGGGSCDSSYPDVCIPPSPPTSTAATSPSGASGCSLPIPTASTAATTTAWAARAEHRNLRCGVAVDATSTNTVGRGSPDGPAPR